jgi:hypothetical protein
VPGTLVVCSSVVCSLYICTYSSLPNVCILSQLLQGLFGTGILTNKFPIPDSPSTSITQFPTTTYWYLHLYLYSNHTQFTLPHGATGTEVLGSYIAVVSTVGRRLAGRTVYTRTRPSEHLLINHPSLHSTLTIPESGVGQGFIH